jgi:hypothetical protein
VRQISFQQKKAALVQWQWPDMKSNKIIKYEVVTGSEDVQSTANCCNSSLIRITEKDAMVNT